MCAAAFSALLVVWVAAAGAEAPTSDADALKVATWNIAAINNNPFEYWITHDDAEYQELMKDVQAFIDEPGDGDVPLDQVLTPAMVSEISERMKAEGWDHVDEALTHFNSNYANRPIVSRFIRDDDLGKKRLVSMPDRLTNTINLKDGSAAYRPTVINCYGEMFATPVNWWEQWMAFHFDDALELASGDTKRPAELWGPISRAKYPALTEEEETISKPLSALCEAAFDAILVHMMNSAGGGSHKSTWQPLRADMCRALNARKGERTLEILNSPHYADADVIFLQEVAAGFVKQLAASRLGRTFQAIVAHGDGKRDQNSAILINRARFDVSTIGDLSLSFEHTIAQQGKVPIAPGDVLVVSINERARATGERPQTYVLASFHGDTNGLATIPVVTAVHGLLSSTRYASAELIFGLDANTYERGSSSKQGVLEFAEAYTGLGLTSCWGDHPDPTNHTTFNARTYLQPQLNKAVKQSDLALPGVGDKNPKDFILFRGRGHATVLRTWKDNTGEGTYKEGIPFPTLAFPSDHGILGTVVQLGGHR